MIKTKVIEGWGDGKVFGVKGALDAPSIEDVAERCIICSNKDRKICEKEIKRGEMPWLCWKRCRHIRITIIVEEFKPEKKRGKK